MKQDYKNHRQIVYSYYFLTGVPIMGLLGIAIYKAFSENDDTREFGLILLLIGWILLTMLFRSRRFALIAQDRAIRAEESLRYFILTGKPIDKRLTLGQIIALRFASDAEFPSLAQKAAEQDLPPDEIKKTVKDWRADLRRV